jgi:Tol biopolymer transport system component
MMKKLQLFVLAASVVAICHAGTAQAQAPRASGEPLLVAGSEESAFMRPIWSPTGDRIAMAGHAFAGLYVADVTTGEVNRISSEAGAGFGAEWSHDGIAILARVSEQDGARRNHAIKLFDLSAGSEVALTDYRPVMRALPRWSVDGTRVLLSEGERVEVIEARAAVAAKAADPAARTALSRGAVLSVAGADASPRELLTADNDILRVANSADGRRIAFEVLGGNLYVMSADGQTRVSFGRGEAARFSPDGEWIVFMRTEDDGHHITGSDLYIGRVSDGSISQLTSTADRFEMNPDWSPDGRFVAYDDRGSVYLLPIQQ